MQLPDPGGHSTPRTLSIATLAALSLLSASLAACGAGRSDADAGDRARAAESRRDVLADADARAATAYEVAVAQAEGAHSVAIERCGAFRGDARQACRDRADADLELAKSRARRARDSRT